MYVQTYREQQQLQQENNQSPGPPAPPPDIEVLCKNQYEKVKLSTQESRIMREVTVFSLASHMVWCLWGLKQVSQPFETVCGKVGMKTVCYRQLIFQGQTSSIPFAYYHFARDKLEDCREAKARAETLLLEAEVVSS